MTDFALSQFTLVPILPEIFLVLSAMGFLLVGAIFGQQVSRVSTVYAVISAFIAVGLVFEFSFDHAIILGGMFKTDPFIAFVKILICTALGFYLVFTARTRELDKLDRYEFDVLVLLAGVGMMLLVSSANFLSLYMALELQSLALYVLAAFHTHSRMSSEAGVTDVVLGALSSGLLLFGISLI